MSYSQAYGKKPSIAYRDKTTYTLEVFLTAEDGKKIDKCYVDFQVEWTEEIITKTETIER